MKYYLGVDLGGTNIAAGVVDENHTIVAKESIPTNAGRPAEEIVEDIFTVSKRVAQKANVAMESFTSWGIGMPSYVNPKTHLLVHANNFGWINFPIFDFLKKHTDMPIYIENDANCATLGETLAGAARNYNNAIMLTLGTGVGGGIILSKRIFSGCDLMGAELGHTKLVYNGITCTCGQKGCLESYCSATALIRQAKEALKDDSSSLMWELCDKDLKNIDGKVVVDASKRGDNVAKKLVDQYIDYLSCGLSTFVTIFRPEVIILGGGLADAGEVLFEPLNKRLYENTFAASVIGIPKIVKAELGNDAGIIGAALLEKYAEKR